MCWTINLDKKNLAIECFDFKKYSSFTFLDPMRNIFGIFIKGSTPLPEEPTETPAVESTVIPKYETQHKLTDPLNESKDKLMNSSGIYSKKYYFPSREYEGKRSSTSRERDQSLQQERNFKYIKVGNHNFSKGEDKPTYAKNSERKEKTNSIYSVSQFGRTQGRTTE